MTFQFYLLPPVMMQPYQNGALCILWWGEGVTVGFNSVSFMAWLHHHWWQRIGLITYSTSLWIEMLTAKLNSHSYPNLGYWAARMSDCPLVFLDICHLFWWGMREKGKWGFKKWEWAWAVCYCCWIHPTHICLPPQFLPCREGVPGRLRLPVRDAHGLWQLPGCALWQPVRLALWQPLWLVMFCNCHKACCTARHEFMRMWILAE